MLVRPGFQAARPALAPAAARPADVPSWARGASEAISRALGDRRDQIDWARSTFTRGHAESIDVQLVMRDGSRRALVVTDQFSDALQVMTPRAYNSRVGL